MSIRATEDMRLTSATGTIVLNPETSRYAHLRISAVVVWDLLPPNNTFFFVGLAIFVSILFNSAVAVGGVWNGGQLAPSTKFHVTGDSTLEGAVVIRDDRSSANSTLYISKNPSSTENRPSLFVMSDIDVRGAIVGGRITGKSRESKNAKNLVFFYSPFLV